MWEGLVAKVDSRGTWTQAADTLLSPAIFFLFALFYFPWSSEIPGGLFRHCLCIPHPHSQQFLTQWFRTCISIHFPGDANATDPGTPPTKVWDSTVEGQPLSIPALTLRADGRSIFCMAGLAVSKSYCNLLKPDGGRFINKWT